MRGLRSRKPIGFRQWVVHASGNVWRFAETEEPVCKKTVVPRTIYLTADTKGIWHTDIHENMEVARGDILGYCTDFYGEVIKNYYAEADGVVFYYNAGLSVKEGTALVAYGIREHMIADEV